MRSAPFACLTALALSACSDQNSRVIFVQMTWMEWPAEVLAAQPFTVRLVGYGGACGADVHFDPGTTVDNSAVTFEPFFLVSGPPLVCPVYARAAQLAGSPPLPAFFDTRASVSGLTPQSPRSYEIRGAADVSATPNAPSALPVRTFGEIVVRSAAADTSRTNAGGNVYAVRDTAGCVEIYAGFTRYAVENPPADTASSWSGFVTGYIYKAAAPVCGESVVFHMVSRN